MAAGRGLRLVAVVDLVLGPFITFLIFDLSKPRREIVFDLAVIIAIQFGALGYGVHTAYSQRPVAIVLIDDFVVSAIEEYYGGKLTAIDDLKRHSEEHPPIIFSDLPMNKQGLEDVNRIKIEENVLEHAQLQLYRPQSDLKIALQQRQLRFIEQLGTGQRRHEFESWLKQNQRAPDEVLIAPFSGRYGDAWLIFDQNAKYLSYF